MGALRFLTAGESHGPSLTAILEGIPAGLSLDAGKINRELARRQQGYGRGGRMKIETDTVRVLSGVRFGETLGSPITLSVENRDWQNWQERMAAFGEPQGDKVTAARPGHADLTGVRKYAREDVRDILERASARETAMRVAVGAVAKELLYALGVTVESAVLDIGGVTADAAKREAGAAHKAASDLNCFDEYAEEKMKEKIRAAKEAGDTLGGIFEVRISGAPLGLGSHIQWDRRLDARLAAAMMSIQAIKGVEIGAGFGYAALSGSEAHDEMFCGENGAVVRRTNRAGGLEGGMTNGEDIVVRAVMKPIPTLMKPLHSVDIAKKEPVLASKERSDVCAVPAASVVGEAMAAFVLAEAFVEKFDSDNLRDMQANIAAYKKRTEEA
ncbi:chorismate synthase [Selenomonas sp.]|uniref:chorismate synthase n=1 Tax=Selenomonas sp. TaxID=2053611 RepID=UPI003FA238F3